MHTANTSIRQIDISAFNAGPEGIRIFTIHDYINLFPEIISLPYRGYYYTLFFIHNSSGTINIDSRDVHPKSFSIVVVPPGQLLACGLQSFCAGYVLMFTDNFFNAYNSGSNLPAELFLSNSIEADGIIECGNDVFLALSKLFDELYFEFSAPADSMQPEILACLLNAILLKIQRKLPEMSINYVAQQSTYLQFRTLLESNFQNNRSVNYYADMLNISTKKLTRVTTNSIGKTPKQLIDERLYLESKRLLSNSDLSVKEISVALGFSDPSNFNKFFRKHHTLTPLSIRQPKNLYLP
ncbi:MAG: helix-turn-helix domain-containing protein [Ignavibacteria bacterium]|nr:helix-turn-helix domain-containing protein [Ignavibacteria bacterium]